MKDIIYIFDKTQLVGKEKNVQIEYDDAANIIKSFPKENALFKKWYDYLTRIDTDGSLFDVYMYLAFNFTKRVVNDLDKADFLKEVDSFDEDDFDVNYIYDEVSNEIIKERAMLVYFIKNFTADYLEEYFLNVSETNNIQKLVASEYIKKLRNSEQSETFSLSDNTENSNDETSTVYKGKRTSLVLINLLKIILKNSGISTATQNKKDVANLISYIIDGSAKTISDKYEQCEEQLTNYHKKEIKEVNILLKKVNSDIRIFSNQKKVMNL
ncbi:MAG TPA: hypothetical protein GXZ87_06515 [Bacteroidales bacterium]|nr:hypothetical protein [Bacteroidales bacterium]